MPEVTSSPIVVRHPRMLLSGTGIQKRGLLPAGCILDFRPTDFGNDEDVSGNFGNDERLDSRPKDRGNDEMGQAVGMAIASSVIPEVTSSSSSVVGNGDPFDPAMP